MRTNSSRCLGLSVYVAECPISTDLQMENNNLDDSVTVYLSNILK